MKRLLGLLCGAGVLLAACGAYYDPYYYDDVYYDPYYYAYDSSYVYGWYDPFGVYYFASSSQAQTATIDLNAAAAAIAARAPNYFTPAGCFTATPAGPTVTFVYKDCVGEFESKPVSGTVMVVLSLDNGQLVFTANSTDLTIDGSPFILDFTAVATSAGTQRIVTFDSHSRSPDVTDSRQTQGTLTWTQGSTCTVLNASGSSTRKARRGSSEITATSTIVDLERCDRQCPTAGTVAVDSPNGVFTGTFNGGGTLTVEAPNGKQKTYDLQCQ